MSSMLPPAPKTLGMLGDVLISALKSVQGLPNALELRGKRSVCVIMVDGLGSVNLKAAGAHAGFLNSKISIQASCYYPATTATSIVSFATGMPPWQTGFLGYQVFDRVEGLKRNLLSGWESYEQAKEFQSQPTVSEHAFSLGIDFFTIAPAAYEKSGFTGATMRGSRFLGTKSIQERFETAKNLMATKEPKVIYLYVPELDQTAHAKGWKSNEWLNLLESLDSEIAGLARSLGKTSAFIVTADHGVIDIASANHIYIDEFIGEGDLVDVGGDTRGLFLYLKDSGRITATMEHLESRLSDSCYIITPENLRQAGYWKSNSFSHLLPDIIVLAKKEVALYHRGFAKRKSLDMVGHHGSISQAELSVPLITIGF
jgi:predicted AlkP superfamily pyrophosphatase or phosphodiesterase